MWGEGRMNFVLYLGLLLSVLFITVWLSLPVFAYILAVTLGSIVLTEELNTKIFKSIFKSFRRNQNEK